MNRHQRRAQMKIQQTNRGTTMKENKIEGGPTDEELFEVLCYVFEIQNEGGDFFSGLFGNNDVLRNEYIDNLINKDIDLKDLIDSTKMVRGDIFLQNMLFLKDVFNYGNYDGVFVFSGIGISIIKNQIIISVLFPGFESVNGKSMGLVLRTLSKSQFYKSLSIMKNKINIPSSQWNPNMADHYLRTGGI